MKLRKAIIIEITAACLFLNLLLSPASTRVQSIGNVQWGATVDSLQMSISVSDTPNLSVPEFQVAIRNAGEQDLTVKLGHMLANGKVQLPESISLNLTDAGKTRKLKFFDGRYPGVGGRVDDYVVPLRAGSTYTLQLRLDQFWSPDTKDFALKLSPGKNQITAQFEGHGPTIRSSDMSGIKLMNFWLGTLQSNTIVLER